MCACVYGIILDRGQLCEGLRYGALKHELEPGDPVLYSHIWARNVRIERQGRHDTGQIHVCCKHEPSVSLHECAVAKRSPLMPACTICVALTSTVLALCSRQVLATCPAGLYD